MPLPEFIRGQSAEKWVNRITSAIAIVLVVVCLFALAGCSAAGPVREQVPVKVKFEIDGRGVPVCNVNGTGHELTEEETIQIGQRFIDRFCPVKPKRTDVEVMIS